MTSTVSVLTARYRAVQRSRALRAAVGTAGFLVGLAGEALLLKQRGIVGAVLLGIGALAASWAWTGVRETFSPDSSLTRWGRSTETRLRAAGAVISLCLCLAGLTAWQVHPDAVFGLQGLSWLVSIAVLAASCRCWAASTRVSIEEPPWSRAEVAILIAIVAISLVTHLAWLNEIPWRYHGDELTAYNEAMRFYRGPAISLFLQPGTAPACQVCPSPSQAGC